VRIAGIMCAMRTNISTPLAVPREVTPGGLTGGGPALFRLVRFWSRRWAADAARQVQRGAGDAAHVGHVLVLEAIDAAGGAASGNARGLGSAAAIADVAVQLGLDRSNASRMLASAVAAGLVTKTTHPGDARRTELAITPPGRDLLAAARAWQDQVFARLVADWPAADARRLAGYLQRLAAQSTEAPGGRP
jgi:DNA-binding MarR family transcriptional regulator